MAEIQKTGGVIKNVTVHGWKIMEAPVLSGFASYDSGWLACRRHEIMLNSGIWQNSELTASKL